MEFKFYHADRMGQLKEDMTVNLCERGLSPFGKIYMAEMERHLKGEPMGKNLYREHVVEQVRAQSYPYASSRFSCFFGSNYLEEAVRFAKMIQPLPTHPVKIFEVFATRFVTLDMNHIDYDPIVNPDEFTKGVHLYWTQRISNHGPLSGNRRAPSLEVLMHLPVRIGKQVLEVDIK